MIVPLYPYWGINTVSPIVNSLPAILFLRWSVGGGTALSRSRMMLSRCGAVGILFQLQFAFSIMDSSYYFTLFWLLVLLDFASFSPYYLWDLCDWADICRRVKCLMWRVAFYRQYVWGAQLCLNLKCSSCSYDRMTCFIMISESEYHICCYNLLVGG